MDVSAAVGALLGLPFNADLLAIGIFYFWLGHEFSARHESWQRTLSALTPVLVLGLLGLSLWSSATMDLNARRYDDLVAVTAKALLGIAGVLAISRLMVNYAGGRVTRGLEFIGSRILVIYICHLPFQTKSLAAALNHLHLPYWPARILSFLCGVIGPLLLGELILRRTPVLREVYFPVTARQPLKATTQSADV